MPAGVGYPRVRRGQSRRSIATGYGLGDYTGRSSSTRRHEFSAVEQNANLAADDYIPINMLSFKRTFDAANPDVEPTPTASNNFQSSQVMNGSYISNYRKRITITNTTATGSGSSGVRQSYFLDVYELTFSFFEGYIYQEFGPNSAQGALTTFDSGGNDAGEVEFESPNVTLTANNQKNSKFSQRHLRFVGRIEVPVNAGSVVLNYNSVPPKCRRSNSGMFWGVVLHNNSQQNASNAFSVEVTTETSFEETPSDERLPFVY